MFKGKDPRADLFAGASKPPATGLIAVAQIGLFHDEAPHPAGNRVQRWYRRGRNFLVKYSQAAINAVLDRRNQPNEYVFYLADPLQGAELKWNGEKVTVCGGSVAFTLAGDSCITFPNGANPVGSFTVHSADLLALCPNAGAYDVPRSHNLWAAGRYGIIRRKNRKNSVGLTIFATARHSW